MPLIQDYHIPPPRDWQKFEDMCCDIWRIEWGDPNTEKNGRSGQPQKGVDVSGRMNKKLHGVQCKGKDGRFDPTVVVTETELRKEVEKAKKFTPSLSSFILATTAPSDQAIQEVARQITAEHDQLGLFSVTICSWDDITLKFSDPKFRGVFSKYYPSNIFSHGTKELTESSNTIENKIDLILQYQQIAVPSTVESGDSSADSILDSNIDQYMELSKKKPKQALQQLKELKTKHWDKSSINTKFRIISNLANLYLLLGNKGKAIELYFDAETYAPKSKKLIALNNKAHAYILNKQQTEAIKLLEIILKEFPYSEGTYALIVGANIENKDVRELELLVPEKYRNTKEVTFTLGVAYSSREDWDNAYLWLKKALEKDKDSLRLQELYATVTIQKVLGDKDHILIDAQFTNDDKEEFIAAVNLLESVWNKLTDMGVSDLNFSIAYNLCHSYQVLGKPDKALMYIKKVFEIEPKNLEAVRVAAYLSYLDGEKNDAIDYLKNFKGDKDINFKLLHSEILASNKEYSEALNIIFKIEAPHEKPRLWERKVVTEFRIKCEVEESMLEEAKQLEKVAKDSGSLLTYITLIEYYIYEKKVDKAIELAKDALAGITEFNGYRDKSQLADLLVSIEQYELVLPLCRELVITKEIISAPLKRYFHCLLYADKRKEALQVLKEIPEILHDKTEVLWFKAEVHTKLGEYDKARIVAETLLEREPNNLGIRFGWLATLQRLEKEDELKEFFDNCPEYFDAPPKSQMNLAQHLLKYGDPLEALERAYKLAKDNQDDPDIQVSYSTNFVLLGGYSEKVMVPNKIALGTVYTLKNEQGESKTYSLEEKENIGLNIFDLSHPISKAVVNKKVNDIVTISSNTLTGSSDWSVTKIKSKYINLHHEIMSNYNDRFPDRHDFMMLKFPEDENGELNLDVFWNFADRQKLKIKEIIKEYNDKLLPLGAIAVMFGTNPVEAYKRLIANGTTIKCCAGDGESINNALKLVDKTDDFILDPLMLFTLFSYDIHNEVLKYLGQIFITHSTLDLYFTLSKADFQLERSTFEEIYKWAKNNCSIALAVGEDNIPESPVLDMMDASYLDTIKAAISSNLLLLSNDFSYRSLANYLGASKGVWLQIISIKMLNEGFLSQFEYAKMIGKMALEKIDFTTFNAKNLIELAKEGHEENEQYIKFLLSQLGNDTTDLSLNIRISGEFLNYVWRMPVLEISQKKKFTYMVLNSLKTWESFEISELILVGSLGNRTIEDYMKTTAIDWHNSHFIPLNLK